MKGTITSVTLLFLLSCTSANKNEADNYVAGFSTIHSTDTTRIYKPETDSSDYLHFRPLDIDIWYPASRTEKDTPALFHDILGLLEQRANYYTASTAGNGISQQIAQYYCEQLNCSDSARILNAKTESFNNAKPAGKKFPLIIYMAAYNGMSFENFTLFETLAKNGFVVASISSIGRFPGDMTMKYEDLMEQVNDGIAAMKRLKGYQNIDFSKIGIIGYSWGGLAGSILAGRIPNVSCLVSLDGSEFHHYGKEKEENLNFDSIVNKPEVKTMRLSIPYLRLESAPDTSTKKEDPVYNFTEKLTSDWQIFTVISARHEDFSCLPDLVYRSGNCEQKHQFRTIEKLTLRFFEDHLKNSKTFKETAGSELNKTIQRK